MIRDLVFHREYRLKPQSFFSYLLRVQEHEQNTYKDIRLTLYLKFLEFLLATASCHMRVPFSERLLR